jgi:aldehyde dehydrogenase (NAD+)
VLHRVANLLEGRAAEFEAALSREEGKTVTEARMGEVNRGVELLRYFAGEAWRVGGDTLPPDVPNSLTYTQRVPLGVCSIITPWNYPLSIPIWKIAPALVTGNTVVLKPASNTPLIALKLCELFAEAGLPPGVLNCVVGGGAALGDKLVTDERVKAVSFTGSYNVGHGIYQKTAPRIVRTHLEMGGKNPVIIARDADMETALNLVVRGGFGVTGQACTATSRVIVEKPLLADFSARLTEAARNLVVGPGAASGVQMGPAVSASQRKTDLEYIAIARDEGAQLLAGGGVPEGDTFARGHFVLPTVLGGVQPTMRIAQEEVFGPVIALLAADDLEHAFDVANNIAYGLSAAVVTRDIGTALRFAERAEAGMLKVNQSTIGASIQAPFGGFKQSGSGMFREMGKTGVEFYTQIKTVYIQG